MKKILIFTINLYQKILSGFIKQILGTTHFCRFSPTCSEYAKITIEKEGVLKGSALAITRVFKCQPLYKNNI